MQDRPTSVELIAAVRQFLEHEMVPVLEDQRQRFRARVAANALAIVERELQAGSSSAAEEEAERLGGLLEAPTLTDENSEQVARRLRLELARRIRRGEADGGVWREAVFASTLASVKSKLAIGNPSMADHLTPIQDRG